MHFRLAAIGSWSRARHRENPDDKDPGNGRPVRRRRVRLVEAGPAPVGDKVDIALDHRVPAYRVESYAAQADGELAGKWADAYSWSEGPLAGNGDKVRWAAVQ